MDARGIARRSGIAQHHHIMSSAACLPFLVLFLFLLRLPANAEPSHFQRGNLVAWCIVPFDAKKRGPEERAEMLEKLELHRLAYDWRDEHIPQWDEELAALKKHGIELTAWWFPTSMDDKARKILDVLRRHQLKTQLWVMGGGGKPASAAAQNAMVEAEAGRIRSIAEAAAPLGCTVGLYNHGGWFGEPENEIAILERLKRDGITNVGIVYNLHHGHAHLDRFAVIMEKLKPYLLAVNLNGMTRDGEARGKMILPIGQGEFDLEILRVICDSGWRGLVGILNHTDEDAEARLLDNMDGLEWLLPQLDGKAPAKPKPQPRSWKKPPPIPGASIAAVLPAPFLCSHRPLNPKIWPQWSAFVNRDRMFDYYTKEARHFMTLPSMPELLPEYPGLDGGAFGHWGNQDETTWIDARWSTADMGSMMCGVLRGPGLTVPKAVCVRLVGADGLSACFDPQALDWRIVWRGGFVSVTPHRSGATDGLMMAGIPTERPAPSPFPPDSRYRGYYRHGTHVLFSWTESGTEMLDSAWVKDGKFAMHRGPAAAHPLRDLTRGGPAQWPQVLESRGSTDHGSPYAIDTLTFPHVNPWKTLFFIGDHGFFSNGDVALCTLTGEVWRVSGVDEQLEHLRWRRMATGLHQPLGLVVQDDKVCVLGRDQITRLHDLNGDGEADFYECLTNAYQTSPGGHDFITGLQRDVAGRFYFASGNQGVCRIASGNTPLEVIATGFRNPNGLGLAADGTVTTSSQEGEWTPASVICQLKPGGYYGYGGPRRGVTTELPLVYLPRGVDNSSGGQCFVDSDKWGPLRGQLLHFSFGTGTHHLVLRETLDGVTQGAVVPLPGEFLSGAHRGRFSPRDGQLYVSGMTGWGTYTVADGCLQRVRFTGGPVCLPLEIHTHDNGVRLTFSAPLDGHVKTAGHHFAQCWNYRYGPGYGSPEYSLRHPDTPGHDPLAITSAHLLADGRSLFLEIPQLLPAHQVHLHISLTPDRWQDVFLTAHRLGAPFKEFPGYQPVSKIPLPAAAGEVIALPNRFRDGPAGRPMEISAANGLTFAVKELRAKAGERISLTFRNPDPLPHNWALLRPGTLADIGNKVNQLIAAPGGAARHYVPDSPDVIAWTDIAPAGGSFTIHFNLPATPGDYPFLCTFPGHWQLMNGVLKVE